MGYTKRPKRGYEITDFWPDDTDTEIFIEASPFGGAPTMHELMDHARAKWPDANMDNITLNAEHIHTSAIYYDGYDSIDWTYFIKITKGK